MAPPPRVPGAGPAEAVRFQQVTGDANSPAGPKGPRGSRPAQHPGYLSSFVLDRIRWLGVWVLFSEGAESPEAPHPLLLITQSMIWGVTCPPVPLKSSCSEDP